MIKKLNIIGCGFIGKKIAHLLSKQGISPFCFVHSEKSKLICDSLGFQTNQINLDQKETDLGNELASLCSSGVIAYLVPPQRSGETDLRMKKFVSMLEALSEQPSKIMLISTTGVYGDCKGVWIDELQPTHPQVDRARRRLSTEAELKKYCKKNGVKLIVFRVPGIYAADKLPIKRIMSGEPIVSAADSGFTNRIHADDLAAFCVEALLDDVKPDIYNCCDGHPSTMNDYFFKVADAMNLPRPKEISLLQAQKELSAGMLSYLAESKRISNKKLISNFKTQFKYVNLDAGLKLLKLK